MARGVVSLRQACADRRLLGLDLSPRQEELAALIEQNSMTVCAAGRQSGKSTLAAAALVWNLLLRPDLDARSGSLRTGLCVANSREQAAITLGYARRMIERSPLLRSQLVTARDDRLLLSGDRVLLAMPCSDRHTRGLSASMVVLDELAHFVEADGGGPQTAERIFAAIRPTLTVFGEEARLLATSTPLSEAGLFYELHAKAGRGELPGAAAFTAATRDMNPRVSEQFLAGERLLLGPRDFEREYEAKFTGGEAAFIEPEALAAVVGDWQELPADALVGALVGFDPSFSHDPSAAAVVGRSPHDRGQLVVARVERWQPSRKRARRFVTSERRQQVVDSVLDGVARLASFYGATVVTDQHVPATVIDGLRQRGVGQVTVRVWTPQRMTDAFRALRARIYAGRISLPDEPQLLTELGRVRSRVRSGSSQIELPRAQASHCDMAVALAAAVLELDRKGAPRPLRSQSMLLGDRPERGLQAEPEQTLGLPLTPGRQAVYRTQAGATLVEGDWQPVWQRGR